MGGKDIAVLRLQVDLDVWMVGANVAFPTGVGITSHGHVKAVFGVTGITFADTLIRPKVTNIVALLATVLGGEGRFKDVAVKGPT